MKKAIEIFLTTLLLFLFAITVSYASDLSSGSMLLASIDYDALPMRGGADVPEASAPQTDPTPETSSFRPFVHGHTLPPHLSFTSSVTTSIGLSGSPVKSPAFDFAFSSLVEDVGDAPFSSAVQIGAAALASFAMHELGHAVVASEVGANDVNIEFLATRDGTFFLGSTTYGSMDSRSELPFSMGGLVFSDITFEYALDNYRKDPTTFNTSLMFISGLDFLRYTLFSFYLSEGHDHHDPVAVVDRTPLSRDMLLGTAVAKTMMNAWRIYSGSDKFVPYFDVDKYSTTFNVMVVF